MVAGQPVDRRAQERGGGRRRRLLRADRTRARRIAKHDHVVERSRVPDRLRAGWIEALLRNPERERHGSVQRRARRRRRNTDRSPQRRDRSRLAPLPRRRNARLLRCRKRRRASRRHAGARSQHRPGVARHDQPGPHGTQPGMERRWRIDDQFGQARRGQRRDLRRRRRGRVALEQGRRRHRPAAGLVARRRPAGGTNPRRRQR